MGDYYYYPSPGSDMSMSPGIMSPGAGGPPTVRRAPPMMRRAPETIEVDRGPNNGFAIAVLVISIVAIVVCILIVFLVKPCPAKTGAGGGAVAINVPAGSTPAAAGAAAAAAAVHEPGSAAALDALTNSGDSVVMFHANWCGHCKSTVPEVKKAASDMVKSCPGLKVVLMDGDKLGSDGLKKHGIEGYPTVKHMRDGKPTAEYAGNRKAGSFVDFAKKQCGTAGSAAAGAATAPATGALHRPSTAAELESLVGTGSSIVMFHAGWCPHCKSTLPEFSNAASRMAEAAPGTKIVAAEDVKTREALGKYGVNGFPTIVHIRNGKTTAYQGNRTAESFVDFAKRHQ